MKTILVITDGIGFNQSDKFNAFAVAKKPNYDWLFANSAHSLLHTSGLSVGLPQGQMGNSEVGHMTIGAGRILYQNLVKIDRAIDENTLRQNKALLNLLKKCKTIHIIGLYSDGGVHSHKRHFDEIYKICTEFKSVHKDEKDGKISQNSKVWAHLITDGRDVSPKSGLNFIAKAQENMKIATICGRFYAMDRDKRWERVKSAYDAMMGEISPTNLTPSEYIEQSYTQNITDEFIKPAIFNGFSGIKPDDGVIFINFRNDRAREICAALGETEFDGFKRKFVVPNLITMTNYDEKFSFPVMFENDEIKDTLSEVISKANLSQLHTAETEKYAHVTFFLNGGKENPALGETRVLIPSPKVATYDEKPEMSAFAVCDAVLSGIKNGQDFIVVNFANGDMVGHTGNFDAAIKAVEAVDQCLGQILRAAKEHGYAYVQISDHGNCEAMMDESGEILTNHTTFDVFCFVVANGVKAIKNGGLSNVAPTILKLMELKIPEQMDAPLF